MLNRVAQLAMVVLLLCPFTQAYADLLISPTRIAFGERDRVKEVQLINTSNKRRTYRVEFVEQKAVTEGGYIKLTESEASTFNIASPFIRFSPRQVSLEPGQRQTIKLLARRKSGMNAPEYRSHLKFTVLPEVDEKANEVQEGMSLKLDVFLSYTIPIFLRNSQQEPNIAISNLERRTHNNGKLMLDLRVLKTNQQSVAGRLVAYQKNDSGEEIEVGVVNGVNIFHELKERNVSIELQASKYMSNKPITVRFLGIQEFFGKTLAESSI
ncbi:MAG: fimbrial chaperone protein [Glaciecola sp.]|jgi:fimbrial chaperone protein